MPLLHSAFKERKQRLPAGRGAGKKGGVKDGQAGIGQTVLAFGCLPLQPGIRTEVEITGGVVRRVVHHDQMGLRCGH